MNAKLERYLSERSACYRTIDLGGAVTAQEQADTAATSGWAMAKVLVVMVGHEAVLAAIPACCLLDLNRLRALTGQGELRLATVEEASLAVPECAPGAIPPFGAPYRLRTFIDRALLRAREVTMPAGDFATGIRMRPAELRRLAAATVGDFSILVRLARPSRAPRAPVSARKDGRPVRRTA